MSPNCCESRSEFLLAQFGSTTSRHYSTWQKHTQSELGSLRCLRSLQHCFQWCWLPRDFCNIQVASPAFFHPETYQLCWKHSQLRWKRRRPRRKAASSDLMSTAWRPLHMSSLGSQWHRDKQTQHWILESFPRLWIKDEMEDSKMASARVETNRKGWSTPEYSDKIAKYVTCLTGTCKLREDVSAVFPLWTIQSNKLEAWSIQANHVLKINPEHNFANRSQTETWKVMTIHGEKLLGGCTTFFVRKQQP